MVRSDGVEKARPAVAGIAQAVQEDHARRLLDPGLQNHRPQRHGFTRHQTKVYLSRLLGSEQVEGGVGEHGRLVVGGQEGQLPAPRPGQASTPHNLTHHAIWITKSTHLLSDRCYNTDIFFLL